MLCSLRCGYCGRLELHEAVLVSGGQCEVTEAGVDCRSEADDATVEFLERCRELEDVMLHGSGV